MAHEINEAHYEAAKEKFKNFLEQNKHRKTPERFAILKEIYINQHHFDAEELYIKMKRNAYRVSRATIYNTLDILGKCDLIRCHQFGDNKTLYERSYGIAEHDHVICTSCGDIKEFDDQYVREAVVQRAADLGWRIQRHALNIYALCDQCKEDA